MTTVTSPQPVPPHPRTGAEPEAIDEMRPQPELAPADEWDDEEMPTRPRRRPFGPFTAVLCALVLAAGAFGGGVLIEKRHVPAATAAASFTRAATSAAATSGTGTRTATTAGATSGQGSGGAVGAGSGATSGTVTLVDGANVYVTEAGGTVVKVTTSPQSQITVTSQTTTANIKPGDTVTVIGSAGTNGTINATSVRDTGAGASRVGGSGAPSGAGTAGSATAPKPPAG
jgi:hypothetical protein